MVTLSNLQDDILSHLTKEQNVQVNPRRDVVRFYGRELGVSVAAAKRALETLAARGDIELDPKYQWVRLAPPKVNTPDLAQGSKTIPPGVKGDQAPAKEFDESFEGLCLRGFFALRAYAKVCTGVCPDHGHALCAKCGWSCRTHAELSKHAYFFDSPGAVISAALSEVSRHRLLRLDGLLRQAGLRWRSLRRAGERTTYFVDLSLDEEAVRERLAKAKPEESQEDDPVERLVGIAEKLEAERDKLVESLKASQAESSQVKRQLAAAMQKIVKLEAKLSEVKQRIVQLEQELASRREVTDRMNSLLKRHQKP